MRTPLPQNFYQTFSPRAGEFLRNAPSKRHHSWYIRLFFKGTYSVVSFYDLMGVS